MKRNNEEGSIHPRKWWHWVLMYPTLAIAIFSATPQITNWLHALELGVQPTEVSLAMEQERLWKENFNSCRNAATETIKTITNHTLEVTLCPSGDVLVRFTDVTNGRDKYQWVGIDTFGQRAEIPNLLFGNMAYASELEPAVSAPILLAQESKATTLCQNWRDDGKIVRIRQYPDGRCIKEVINPHTGAVISSTELKCPTEC